MSKFSLTVNQKEIGFHVGVGFLGFFQSKHQVTLSEMVYNLEQYPFEWAPKMMYDSAVYRQERDDNTKKLSFSLDNLIDWLDLKGGIESIGLFNAKFREFLETHLPDQDTEDSKKK